MLDRLLFALLVFTVLAGGTAALLKAWHDDVPVARAAPASSPTPADRTLVVRQAAAPAARPASLQ